MELLARYATQSTFYFPVVKAGVTDFAGAADWTPVAGDAKLSRDGGNVAPTTNSPVAVSGAGGALWALTLTAAELTAARVAVQIVDSPAKAVEDQALLVATYGHASAAYAFDFSLSAAGIADVILTRPISSVEGGSHPFRSLYGLIAKLVNKTSIAGNTMTITQTDDATPVATQALTRDATAEPVVSVDTN